MTDQPEPTTFSEKAAAMYPTRHVTRPEPVVDEPPVGIAAGARSLFGSTRHTPRPVVAPSETAEPETLQQATEPPDPRDQWAGRTRAMPAADAVIEAARRNLSQFGNEKLVEALNETALGDHAAIVRAFAELDRDTRSPAEVLYGKKEAS